MDGEQGRLRDTADRAWNPRSLSGDNGSAASSVDAVDHGPSSCGDINHDAVNAKYCNCYACRIDRSRQRSTSDRPSSLPPIDSSESDSGRSEHHPVLGDVSAPEHLTILINYDPDGSDFDYSVRLFNDAGEPIGRYRSHCVTNISEKEYQQNFVNLVIVLAVALVLASIGGKLNNIGAWMLGLMLVAFALFEGIYYSKNGAFFTYKIQGGT
jgi:hypothetical protein